MVTPRFPLTIGSWATRGACLDADPDLFVGDDATAEDRNAAVAICRNKCPVQHECLAHALENDERFGIWGGKTERQRRQIRNAAARAARRTARR